MLADKPNLPTFYFRTLIFIFLASVSSSQTAIHLYRDLFVKQIEKHSFAFFCCLIIKFASLDLPSTQEFY
jgi:hypothetical protein